jgi:hypothetical protein
MIKRGMSETYEVQKDKELESIIGSFVAEVKAELGEQASVNEIEAALLKKQAGLMTKLMQNLVNNQDFPPSGLNG